MPKFIEMLRTLLWFLQRPQLLPELWRQIGVLLRGRSPYFREEAESYCEEHGVGILEAMRSLGFSPDIDSIQTQLAGPVSAALKKTEAVAEKMGGGASMDLLFALAQATRARKILETGVAFGWSSLAILAATRDYGGSHLVSVDMPYVKGGPDDLVGLAVPDELRDRWTLIRRADREGLPQAIKILREVDLAHYDSDKTVEGRDFAYPLIWKSLSPGGVFISDDVSDNVAFLRFCGSIGLNPIIVNVGGKFAGIVRKPTR